MLVIIKAITARIMFGCHGFLVIWQVVTTTGDKRYWFLSLSLVTLFLETLFTMILRESREWQWFCPSVFIYLSSVVPAIWFLELDKLARGPLTYFSNSTTKIGALNLTSLAGLNLGLAVEVSQAVWVTLLEQFLMLALILGRWMLPLGTLTREQLSQLLLVNIGTAADIIEFFDSFKDDRVADKEILVFLVLAIWSWSLLQFTLVIPTSELSTIAFFSCLTCSSTPKSKKNTTGNGNEDNPHYSICNNGEDDEGRVCYCCGCSYMMKKDEKKKKKEWNKSPLRPSLPTPYPSSSSSQCCCCSEAAVCSVFLEIILQDAPFLVFRLLLILHYRIVSYMNVFFAAKNSLVIALQFYRLVVVQVETRKRVSAIEKSINPPHLYLSGNVKRDTRNALQSYDTSEDEEDEEKPKTNKRVGVSLIELREFENPLMRDERSRRVRLPRSYEIDEAQSSFSFEDAHSWLSYEKPFSTRQKSQCQYPQTSFSEEESLWINQPREPLSLSPSPAINDNEMTTKLNVKMQRYYDLSSGLQLERPMTEESLREDDANKPARMIDVRSDSGRRRRQRRRRTEKRGMVSEATKKGKEQELDGERHDRVGPPFPFLSKGTAPDTGYSSASTPIWHSGPRGTQGTKKPKLLRQERIHDSRAKCPPIHLMTFRSHCNDESGHDEPLRRQHRHGQQSQTFFSRKSGSRRY